MLETYCDILYTYKRQMKNNYIMSYVYSIYIFTIDDK